jgi:hypothetical protein
MVLRTRLEAVTSTAWYDEWIQTDQRGWIQTVQRGWIQTDSGLLQRLQQSFIVPSLRIA